MKRSLDDDTRQHGDHYRKTQRRRSRNTSRQPIQRYQNYSIPPAPTNVPPYPQQYQLVGGSVEQAAWPQQLQPNYQDTRQRSPSSSSTLIYNQVQPQIQQLQGHQQQQQQYPHHLHQQEQQRRTFRPYVIPSPAAFDYRQQYQQTVQYPYNQYRFVQVTGIPSRANLSDIVDICLGSGVLESVTRSSRQIPSHALIGFVEPADAYQFITRLGRPYSILGKFVTVTWASRQDTLESRSKLNQHLALGHTVKLL